MIDIRKELIATLKEGTDLLVYYQNPPINVSTKFPLLILEEVGNSDLFYDYQAQEDYEYELTNVTFEVSIYCLEYEDIIVFAPIIDRIMKHNNFKKTWTSPDSYIDPIYCKTLRFVAKVRLDKNTNTYYII